MNPKLKFIHPNMKGTGTTVEFELRPATELDMGCMLVSFTPQKTIGDIIYMQNCPFLIAAQCPVNQI